MFLLLFAPSHQPLTNCPQQKNAKTTLCKQRTFFNICYAFLTGIESDTYHTKMVNMKSTGVATCGVKPLKKISFNSKNKKQQPNLKIHYKFSILDNPLGLRVPFLVSLLSVLKSHYLKNL